jgi:hypothetical protein
MQRPLRDLFVDRSQHRAVFRKMLDGQTSRRIMLLEAGAGMGKSWLLHIFAHEAKSRNVPLVHIDFADRQPYDTIMLVRRCRDSFGPGYFNPLTQAINDVTIPRVTFSTVGGASPATVDVNIGSENVLTNSAINVGEVGTIIKDNFFTIRTDDLLVRQAIEDRINLTFFACLEQLCKQTSVLFLFDSYERNSLKPDRWISRSADRWICGQLLARIREGTLNNAVVVLAGQMVPRFGITWNEILGRLYLDPFRPSDVKEYLCERRRLLSLTDIEVERFHQAVAGHPQLLGLIADNLEQANRPALSDDDW